MAPVRPPAEARLVPLPLTFRLILAVLGFVQAAWAGAFAYGLAARLEAGDEAGRVARIRARDAVIDRVQGLASRVFAPGTHREAVRITRLIAAEQPLVRLTLVGPDPEGSGTLAVLASNAGGVAPAGVLGAAASPPPGAEGGLMRWEADPPRLSLLMTRTLDPPPAPAAPSSTPRPPAPERVHVVRPGDTLYRISRERYGHPGMHDAIWQANRDRLSDRTGLVSGMALRLPPEPEATPSATPTPEATPRVLGPGRLALRIEVPVPPEALPTHQAGRAPWVGISAALGALGWWWLAVHLLLRRRRRDLLGTRAGLQHLVGSLIERPVGAWTPEAARSPWHVELAHGRWEAPVTGLGVTDWRLLSPGCLGVLLLATEGPALPALVARGQARLLWRVLASEGGAPERTLAEVERRLRAEGTSVSWRACYLRLDLQSGEATYATLRFGGVYALGRGGTLTRLGPGAEDGAAGPSPGRYAVAEGESLLLVSDGLLAVENAEGEPFGLERLQRSLRERPGVPAEEVVASIEASLSAFSGSEAHDVEAAVACLRLANRYVAAGRNG